MDDLLSKLLKVYYAHIKERYKVKETGVFGSQIKGEAKKKSDIDILVEFEEEYNTFDSCMQLKYFIGGKND